MGKQSSVEINGKRYYGASGNYIALGAANLKSSVKNIDGFTRVKASSLKPTQLSVKSPVKKALKAKTNTATRTAAKKAATAGDVHHRTTKSKTLVRNSVVRPHNQKIIALNKPSQKFAGPDASPEYGIVRVVVAAVASIEISPRLTQEES